MAVTLAVCLGDEDALWTGADLDYVAPLERPGTPDLSDPSVVVVRHRHAAGVGVLHGGDAYHRVTPLAAGERATLVVQAMLDDGAKWKHGFLDFKGRDNMGTDR